MINIDKRFAQGVCLLRNQGCLSLEESRIQRYDPIEKILQASASNEGLPECKAPANNLGRIQVRDIIKEVEDYLKTYSSAGMDISWYVEEYVEVLRRVRGGKTLTILLPSEEEQA
ncbi:hypothetical protein Tco_0109874 [Tanacetum coccineum]